MAKCYIHGHVREIFTGHIRRGQQGYIFGGELQPREPRDNHVHVTELAKDMRRYASIILQR